MYEYLIELSREEFHRNQPTMLSDWPKKAELFEKTLKQSGLPIYYFDSDIFFNLIATQYRGYKYFFNKKGNGIRYEVYFANYIYKLPAKCLMRLHSIINQINYTYTPASIHIESGKIEATSRVYTDNDHINFASFRNWIRGGDSIIRAFISAVNKDEDLMKYITFI